MIIMSAEILKAAFDPFYMAPLEAWQDFAKYCEEVTYPKDHIVKEAEGREKYLHFMKEGSAGVFLWKENNFVCLDFAFEHHFWGDYMSLLTGMPSLLQIITLEECKTLRISREHFMELGQTPIGIMIMKVAAEFNFIAKQQQQIDLLTKTAEQRYLDLLQHNPHVINRVAQKHLASFLGITPQSFSRIRKKIM